MGIGRVGNNQLTNKLLFQLKGQLQLQERLFEQISSNKRILRASDDPIGAAQSMMIRDQITRANEYDNTVKTAEVSTNVTAAALDSASSTWKKG